MAPRNSTPSSLYPNTITILSSFACLNNSVNLSSSPYRTLFNLFATSFVVTYY
jgi:hypothetical protein